MFYIYNKVRVRVVDKKDLSGRALRSLRHVMILLWFASELDNEDCVQLVRKVVGATKPSEALPGTIRGDFCSHTSHNIIHASDSDESAEREINLFFKPEELIDWKDEAACWF